MDGVSIEAFIEQACQLGAVEAKMIDPKSVVTAAWVRMKCQFGCDGYNTSHCCPPRTPTAEQTQVVINCYSRALLIHCNGETSPTRIVTTLERDIFLQGFYKVFAFGAGPCRLCSTCRSENCIQAEKARPSMEACGIDVFATARANGYPIEVLRDYSCEENRYGLILVD